MEEELPSWVLAKARAQVRTLLTLVNNNNANGMASVETLTQPRSAGKNELCKLKAGRKACLIFAKLSWVYKYDFNESN